MTNNVIDWKAKYISVFEAHQIFIEAFLLPNAISKTWEEYWENECDSRLMLSLIALMFNRELAVIAACNCVKHLLKSSKTNTTEAMAVIELGEGWVRGDVSIDSIFEALSLIDNKSHPLIKAALMAVSLAYVSKENLELISRLTIQDIAYGYLYEKTGKYYNSEDDDMFNAYLRDLSKIIRQLMPADMMRIALDREFKKLLQ